MAHSLPRILGYVARAGAAVAFVVVAAGADCLGEDPPPPPECTANCAIEVECGFRSEEDCKATSCDAEGLPIDVAADTCLSEAADCLAAAACACDAGCAKVDECTEGEPDPECVNTCDTLVEQQPNETYLENRCKIEKSCEDLATCSSVSG